MSQHLATATLDGRTAEIVAGFDRRLGDQFLQVIDARNDMLYTSLLEPLRSGSTKSKAMAVDARASASPATWPTGYRSH
jgi:hypothetical protein